MGIPPALFLGTLACALVSTLDAQQGTSTPDTTSKEPPRSPNGGPDWTQDFFAAREQALATGKPIFLYSTKTY